MRLYRRGTTWWVSFHDTATGTIRRSTHCTDKTAAASVARRFEREAADPRHAATHAETITDALARLISTRQEQVDAGRRAQGTVTFYTSKAGHWTRLLGAAFPLATLTAATVDAVITQRRSEGAAETTIHKELVTLRAALKLAVRAGTWDGRVERVIPVAFSPEYKPRTRYLQRTDVEGMLRILPPDDAARVAFIVATSACWHETELAQRMDVNLHAGTVHVRGTKRSARWRTVPMARPWQAELAIFAVTHAQGRDGAMFRPVTTLRWALRHACTELGIPPCSPNDLRRTTATWLRADGAAPDLVAAVLGHADTRMVERVYGRLDVEALRARLQSDCADFVHDSQQTLGQMGQGEEANPLKRLPRDGIEPPTRGFSILPPKRKTG